MAESAVSPGDALGIAQRAGDWLFGLLPFTTSDRTHWTGLAAFLLIGSAIWFCNRRTLRAEGFSGLVNFLVPAHIYFSRSSLVDAKVFLANRVLSPLVGLFGQGLLVAVAAIVAQSMGGLIHDASKPAASTTAIVLATICMAIAGDFGTYWTHRLHHERSVLWPFHKLHHSAEHLTPLTVFRKHPVYDLISSLIRALCIGPVFGFILALFGVLNLVTILGVSLALALFNVAGANLRHSHIWLDFGPVMDHIFISPAQHQIHHSMAPRHHDRNYGEMLAIWDWAFGTLYIPKGREILQFGVADANGVPEPQVHTSLVTAYAVPFTEAAGALRARRAPQQVAAE